jgi:hypothetical protein
MMKRLMLCEEKGRLLDAYVTATDRQAEAVKALSAVAAKDIRARLSGKRWRTPNRPIHRLRSLLSAIFKLAINQKYVPGPNPMREVEVPKSRACCGKPTAAMN